MPCRRVWFVPREGEVRHGQVVPERGLQWEAPAAFQEPRPCIGSSFSQQVGQRGAAKACHISWRVDGPLNSRPPLKPRARDGVLAPRLPREATDVPLEGHCGQFGEHRPRHIVAFLDIVPRATGQDDREDEDQRAAPETRRDGGRARDHGLGMRKVALIMALPLAA